MPNRIENTRLDSKSIKRDSNGFATLHARVTRVGVFNYRRPDGSVVRELRPPDEVFSQDSIDSLSGIPVTNDHPDTLLDAKTARKHIVGVTGTKADKAEEIYLDTTAKIFDHDAIKDIEDGKEEVSLGYSVDHEDSPGVWDGIPYDRIQRNIRYNHLSIVDRGRAGANVRLRRMDAMDAEMITDEEATNSKEEKPMPKIKVGDKEFDASQELHDAYNAKMTEMDAFNKKSLDEAKASTKADADKELATVIVEKSDLQKKLDAADAKVVVLEKESKERTDAADTKHIDQLVEERSAIRATALKAKADMKLDGLSNEEIKKMVVAEKFPEVKLDGRSAEFVDGLFESVAKQSEKKTVNMDRLSKTLSEKLDGVNEKSADEARKKATEESKDAWKTDLNKTKGA